MTIDKSAAAQIYLDSLKHQVDDERNRRGALEQRGVAVTSTSATLAAVLFTLAGLSLKDGKFHLPGASRYVLVVAILLFVAAAVLGLFASIRSSGYRETPISSFTNWKDTAEGDATVAVVATFDESLTILEWARKENRKKATAVSWALWVEFAAIVLLAGAVAFIILTVG